jgi:hypothetical protein
MFYQIFPVFPIENAICLRSIYHPAIIVPPRPALPLVQSSVANRHISESDIRLGLSGGCGHDPMIPLLSAGL